MGNGTFVGLDVHARSVVAGLIDEDTGELRVTRAPHRTEELARWLGDLAGPVRVAYEAGPTGFGLARACEAAGIACLVAAPSLIARSPAGRGKKSDVTDAENLARLLRRGELTAVRVPDPVDEAARDLVRAREDARADLMRARHRLSKLLLRHGLVFEEGRAWTTRHQAWLRRQRLEHSGARAAFEDYYGAVLAAGLRREGLDARIEELAAQPRFSPVVGRLSCLRGVGTLTAFALAVEIGDFHRLTGRTIGAYLGLVPSESQSGTRHSRGPITKAGNSHARRLLVEAAWHHRRPVRASAVIERRRADQRPEVRARAERAGVRLHHRWHQLERRRGLRSTVVATAVARELAGWCWSLAVMD
ncbi:MAG TPA: IS110 family transposase [Solirubrobacterales bacterium]|nr:IS110 family transposase [Solirubrobacterales bacterium]